MKAMLRKHSLYKKKFHTIHERKKTQFFKNNVKPIIKDAPKNETVYNRDQMLTI